MSHLTEGELHTWLDGALDELGSAEAARVRHHLAGCEACAGRLEEERVIRDAAASILSSAAPEVRFPTLEELRTVAAARESRVRSSRRVQRLGWAATVVVALGTGWMLRGEWAPVMSKGPDVNPATSVMTNEVTDRATPTAAGTVASAEQKAPTEQEAGSENRASQARPQASGTEMVRAEPTVRRPAAPVVSQVAAASEDASKKSVAPNTSTIPSTALEEDVVVAAPTAKRAFPLPRTDSVANIAPPTLVRQKAETAEAAKGVAASSPSAADLGAGRVAAQRREAPAALDGFVSPDVTSHSLAVPGLVVLSVTRVDADGVPEGVRVVQLLSAGDTLELIHLPASRPPRLTERPVEGVTELTLPRPDGWLVARARVSQDSLRALVNRLQQH